MMTTKGQPSFYRGMSIEQFLFPWIIRPERSDRRRKNWRK